MIFPWFRKRNPARDLALLGVEKRRALVIETAKRIRAELGMPPAKVWAMPSARAGRATPRAGSRLGHTATIDYRKGAFRQ